MTKNELRQLFYLNREILQKTEELVEMKIKSRSDGGTAWDKRREKEIAKREAEVLERVQACKAKRRRIKKFINDIDDSFTRQIFYYRYVKCMTWQQVAYMTGGYNSADCVRKIAERYLEKYSKDCKNR